MMQYAVAGSLPPSSVLISMPRQFALRAMPFDANVRGVCTDAEVLVAKQYMNGMNTLAVSSSRHSLRINKLLISALSRFHS